MIWISTWIAEAEQLEKNGKNQVSGLSSTFQPSSLTIDISDPDILIYITQPVSVTGSQPGQARHQFEFYKCKSNLGDLYIRFIELPGVRKHLPVFHLRVPDMANSAFAFVKLLTQSQ